MRYRVSIVLGKSTSRLRGSSHLILVSQYILIKTTTTKSWSTRGIQRKSMGMMYESKNNSCRKGKSAGERKLTEHLITVLKVLDFYV